MDSKSQETDGGVQAGHTGVRRFLCVWFCALAFTLVVLYFELDALAHSWHEFTSADLESKAFAKLTYDPSASVPSFDGKAHASPHFAAAGVQIFAAGFISLMWFEAFRILGRTRAQSAHVQEIDESDASHTRWQRLALKLARLVAWLRAGGWAVGMAFVVVLIFAFAMHQAYQPAVLVMALIAIIVAAEHYSGLLAAVNDLQKVAGDTSRLAEDVGLSHFAHDVYERYASATEIYAVVRMHDIDPVWWTFAKVKGDSPWDRYFEHAKSQLPRPTAEQRNLARALTRQAGHKLSACFVTDLPMPGSEEWTRRLSDLDEPLLSDLCGFAWQWIVVRHAHKPPQVDCCTWVSRPLCWVHATDRVVFQVLRRKPRSRSAVLLIANRDGLALGSGAEDTYGDMVLWAKEEVRRYAERGCTAEDYLLAMLRHAAMLASKTGDAELVDKDAATEDLRYLVELLGSDTLVRSNWRRSESHLAVLDDDTLRTVPGDVFARALVQMFPGKKIITVRDLWSHLA